MLKLDKLDMYTHLAYSLYIADVSEYINNIHLHDILYIKIEYDT